VAKLNPRLFWEPKKTGAREASQEMEYGIWKIGKLRLKTTGYRLQGVSPPSLLTSRAREELWRVPRQVGADED
jgi:hypothetical protein